MACAPLMSDETAGESAWRQSPPEGIAAGDLVFRVGHGIWTRYFIGISSREKRFSHVGIVSRADGNGVVILHADADDTTGVGMVREQDWGGFLAEALECAVYRFTGDGDPLRFIETGRIKLGVPFDPSFDMSDDGRLYCTEFVRYAINSALDRELIGFTLVNGHPFIALDDIYSSEFIKIWDSKKSN